MWLSKENLSSTWRKSWIPSLAHTENMGILVHAYNPSPGGIEAGRSRGPLTGPVFKKTKRIYREYYSIASMFWLLPKMVQHSLNLCPW